MICLETTADCLLPNYFNAWCGDQYILIMTNEQVYQFAADGKFIRQLALRGRAPGEYSALAGFAVDEKKGLFYLSDWQHHLLLYDLKTGNFLGGQKLETESMMKMVWGKQQQLVYLPQFDLEALRTYEVGMITTDGKLLGCVTGKQRKTSERIGMSYLGELHGEIRFCSDYSDTLYTIQGFQKVPALFLDISNRYTQGKNEGWIPEIAFETSRYLLLSLCRQKITSIDGGQEILYSSFTPYLVDKQTAGVEKIKVCWLDWLNSGSQRLNIQKSGKYLWQAVPVIEARQQAEKILKAGKLSSDKAAELHRFLKETQEDDNPLIFRGKIK